MVLGNRPAAEALTCPLQGTTRGDRPIGLIDAATDRRAGQLINQDPILEVSPRYGGFWLRAAAYLIDSIVVALACTTIFAVFFMPKSVTPKQMTTLLNAYTLPVIVFQGVYFTFFWSLLGKTPGMLPFGLSVANAQNMQRIGPGRALLRYFGLVFSFMVFDMGVLWAAIDPRKQGWHDKIAGTVVVRKGKTGGDAVAPSRPK